MKKILIVFTAVLTVLALTATALADMVWEPDNRFYRKHRKQCEYLDRSYYANGPDGFITLWDAPDGSTIKAQYENGTKLRGCYTYNGWGCVYFWKIAELREVSGWVPMDQLYLIYDHISFEEEYGEYFKPYDGQFDSSELQMGDKIWIWEYPNAGEPMHGIPLNYSNMDDFQNADSLFSHTYTDGNGSIWGYVSYFSDLRDFWVLLDSPTYEGVTTSCTPEVDGLISSGEIVPPREPRLPAALYLPYFMTGGVVAVTAALLVVMKWKKPKN